MSINNNNSGALDWDSPIEAGSGFVTLEPGDYYFRVLSLERGTFEPKAGGKLQERCPKATLKIDVGSADCLVQLDHQLILHTKTMGFIHEFFSSIEHRKEGEPFNPKWNSVTGSGGMCRVTKETYAKKEEKMLPPDQWTGVSNKISKFLPKPAQKDEVPY